MQTLYSINLFFCCPQKRFKVPHMQAPGYHNTVEQFDPKSSSWVISRILQLDSCHGDFACLCA